MRLFTPIAILILAIADAGALAQPAYDLRLAPPESERVGVSIRKDINGFRNLKVGDNVQSSDVAIKERIYVADRFAKVEADRLLAQRRYCSWTRTEGKAVKDPEVAGLVVAFLHDKEAGEHQIELDGDRKVRPETLDQLMSHSNSIGFYLDLPAAAPIARHFEIDFSGLLPLLLEGGARATKADFVLKEFSTDSREGQLVGSLIAETTATNGLLELKTVYSGVCTIDVSQKLRRIKNLEWTGLAEFSGGNDAIEITGNADFTIGAKVSAGEGVDERFRADTEFRQVERVISQLGVKFSLPSHWYTLAAEDGSKKHLFQSTVTGTKVNLELSTRDVVNPTSMIPRIEEQVRAQYPAGEFKGCKTTVGDGRMMTFHQEGKRFTIAVVAHGLKRLLEIRIIRDADAPDPVKRELRPFLDSLRPLD